MNAIKIIFLVAFSLTVYGCSHPAHPPTTEVGKPDEPVEEDSHIVSLFEDQVKVVNIELGVLEQKNLSNSIKVNGKLEVPAQNKAMVTSLYEGVLNTLLVHPGSEVRKGQSIATISNTQLAGIQQNFISVNAQLKLAQLEFKRQQELVAGNAAPMKNVQKAQAELSSLQAQHAALAKELANLGISASTVSSGSISSIITLKAPISGTISDIHARIGSKVDIATPVATIVNNSELHLDLFVYEKDLPLVKKNQVIHFTLTNSPGKEYDAKIFSIGTAFADESKSVPVHAEVEGGKTGLIEGMSVTAIISIGSRTAPSVPTEAIVSNGGKDYIFIKTDKQVAAAKPEDDGHGHDHGGDEHAHDPAGEQKPVVNFERIQIIRGASDLGFTEIQAVNDLPANSEIVVKGAFFIMAKMTNTGDHEH